MSKTKTQSMTGYLWTQNRKQLLALLAIGALLASAPSHAHAAELFDFPIVNDLICGFVSYSKNKLTPMIAGGVVIMTIIGQWMGVVKMWDKLFYVGMGFGAIFGIMSLFGKYGSMPSQCLA